jgi:hypothetical protein
MRSDRTLRKWYRQLNRRFFGNQLPDDVCVRWADDTEEREAKWEEKYFGWADPAYDGRHRYVIIMSRRKITSLSLKAATLAHEMCHIATDLKDDHGPAFEQWRQYIGDRGIFKKHAVYKGLTLF